MQEKSATPCKSCSFHDWMLLYITLINPSYCSDVYQLSHFRATSLAKEAGETVHGSLQRYGVVQDVDIDDVVLLQGNGQKMFTEYSCCILITWLILDT